MNGFLFVTFLTGEKYTEIGQCLDLNAQTVQKWAKGVRAIPIKHLDYLNEAYGVSGNVLQEPLTEKSLTYLFHQIYGASLQSYNDLTGFSFLMTLRNQSCISLARHYNISPQMVQSWGRGSKPISKRYLTLISRDYNFPETVLGEPLTLDSLLYIFTKVQEEKNVA